MVYRKSYPFYHLDFSLDKTMYDYRFGDHRMIVDKIMSRDCIFFSEYLLQENDTLIEECTYAFQKEEERLFYS